MTMLDTFQDLLVSIVTSARLVLLNGDDVCPGPLNEALFAKHYGTFPLTAVTF